MLFRIGLPAVLAAEALQAIPMPTKTLAGFLTTRAIHDRGFRFCVDHDFIKQQMVAVCQWLFDALKSRRRASRSPPSAFDLAKANAE